jgi:hypothetical protein
MKTPKKVIEKISLPLMFVTFVNELGLNYQGEKADTHK